MDHHYVMNTWSPDAYLHHAGFVPALGAGVVDLLDPKPGERILDLGCGEGTLTATIRARGTQVVGVDNSDAQVAAARTRGLDARVMDGESLTFDREFDAVFSNAAMHWMRRPDAVIAGVRRALRPGGRFVARAWRARLRRRDPRRDSGGAGAARGDGRSARGTSRHPRNTARSSKRTASSWTTSCCFRVPRRCRRASKAGSRPSPDRSSRACRPTSEDDAVHEIANLLRPVALRRVRQLDGRLRQTSLQGPSHLSDNFS